VGCDAGVGETDGDATGVGDGVEGFRATDAAGDCARVVDAAKKIEQKAKNNNEGMFRILVLGKNQVWLFEPNMTRTAGKKRGAIMAASRSATVLSSA
jgi:hypothetical protein